MNRVLAILLVLIVTSVKIEAVERLLQPYNLNFEDGVAGRMPKGWFMADKFEARGFKAFVNNQTALKGRNSLQFDFIGISDTTKIPDSISISNDPYGFIYQSVDAKDFRSKKIKLKMAIFNENLKDSSHCRLRLTAHFLKDKESQNFIGDSINLKDGWNYYEISCEIDSDADMLNYGVLLAGTGSILIDDASIEFVNNYEYLNVFNTTKLSTRELENLFAFSKLYGYVRYFYPGFEVVETNWDKFGLTGTQYIESAKDKAELIELLNRLYLPVAPGLKIGMRNEELRIENKKPKEALDNIALSWLHKGANLGIPIKNFSNELRNIYLPTRDREAPAIQIVDALDFRGKKVRFSAYVKTDVDAADGHAQLWLGIDDADENVMVFKTTVDEKPITDTEWTKYFLEADVPMDASIIRLALVMLGDGKTYFDNIELSILNKDKNDSKNYSKNPDFETVGSGKNVLSWTLPESAIKAGYNYKVINSEKFKGSASLMIFSDEKTRIIMPILNESISFELVPGIMVKMPLNNLVDSNSTLPIPTASNIQIPVDKPDDFVLNSKDRYSRFTITMLLWNVYRHFGIGIDVQTKWDEILKTALMKASTDSSSEFIITLNTMLSQINDGQGKVWVKTNVDVYGLPILWKWVNEDLVINQIQDSTSGIPLGSVVKTINKIPVNEILKELNEQLTGSTPQWKKLKAAAIMRIGQFNEKVNIQIITPEKKLKEISLERKSDLFELNELRPPQFHILKDNEYYIDLTRITERGLKNIVNDLKEQLPNAQKIIFDLRGFTSLTEDFLGMFLNSNVKSVSRKFPVFTKPGGKPCTFKEISNEIAPKNPFIKSNIYFLIDERTAGTSEIIAALAKKYKIGKLVGTSTSGTSDEVLGINLPGEFNASIVGMLVELPESNFEFKNGIEPDIKIAPTIRGIAEGQDEILEYVYGLFDKK